jgi:hypothetical protein
LLNSLRRRIIGAQGTDLGQDSIRHEDQHPWLP